MFSCMPKKLQNHKMTKKMYCIVILHPIETDGTFCMYVIFNSGRRNFFLKYGWCALSNLEALKSNLFVFRLFPVFCYSVGYSVLCIYGHNSLAVALT